MKKLVRFGALAAAAVLAVTIVAPTFAANEVTIGQFVQRLAAIKQLDATDARVAMDSLRTIGVRLPANLRMDAALTESDVVRISRAVGLRVTSSSPDSPFTDDQVDTFFTAFLDELVPTGGDETVSTQSDGWTQGLGPPFDPFSKGKGKHKGKGKGHQSPTEPE